MRCHTEFAPQHNNDGPALIMLVIKTVVKVKRVSMLLSVSPGQNSDIGDLVDNLHTVSSDK